MLHVILTRFNIASPGREVAIRNSPGWLERRFGLFEQFCLPSIAGQTERNFHWLIYFDKDTPVEFRERIERDRQIFNFTPRYVAMFDKAMIAEDVRALATAGETLIVTTRLDNDDAVSSDFVARVQDAAKEAPAQTVLNFPHGIAMRGGQLYTASDHSSPFTSLVEKDVAGIETIWAKPHHELGEKWTIRQVPSKPLWLQVVHGENVTNRIKGKLVSDIDIINMFKIRSDVAARPVAAGAILWDHAVRTPIRRFREFGIRLVKPIVVRIRDR
uniref:Putative glycosyl transferase n=1 Tax=Sphingomonas sp. ATCC 53159 TaxID=194870 RepID=B4XEU9_9SPHN|nr:putative glycosyl transferase [Sphingomonas sp. ATCC 53159]